MIHSFKLNFSIIFNSTFLILIEYDALSKKDLLVECAMGGNYTNYFMNGKSCEFDYKTIFKATPCTREKNFGYNTEKPCVLVKLNKVIDFVPKRSLEIKCKADVSFCFWKIIFNLISYYLF